MPMRPLNKAASKILDTLTAGLTDEDSHRKIDHKPGLYLPAVIEKIGSARYSVAHYFKQNGDSIADPDVEFVRQDGRWFPAAIQQVLGYSCPVETDEHGRIARWSPRAYNHLLSFAAMFLRNIKAQQGRLTP